VQCAEQLRVQAYFDGELEALAAADVERHVEHCAQCRALLDELLALRARLRALPRLEASAALRQRIAGALPAAPPRPAAAARSPPWRLPGFWLGALGGVGAALAAGLAVLLLSPALSTPLLDEVVAAHVRSLLPEHLTDVLSTDRHTVKPWFAGHADVSPVVADFGGQGYQLLGGRADYFERQRVATLVYRHGAHLINVFSWAAGRESLPRTATRSGYHLACWRDGNLQYCAVSDAGWDELEQLVQLLQRQAARDAPP
jgi:anti-sigma factor RsiW